MQCYKSRCSRRQELSRWLCWSLLHNICRVVLCFLTGLTEEHAHSFSLCTVCTNNLWLFLHSNLEGKCRLFSACYSLPNFCNSRVHQSLVEVCAVMFSSSWSCFSGVGEFLVQVMKLLKKKLYRYAFQFCTVIEYFTSVNILRNSITISFSENQIWKTLLFENLCELKTTLNYKPTCNYFSKLNSKNLSKCLEPKILMAFLINLVTGKLPSWRQIFFLL